MRRHLFFALLILAIFLFFTQSHAYYNRVFKYRASNKSNIKIDKKICDVRLDLLSYNEQKDRLICIVPPQDFGELGIEGHSFIRSGSKLVIFTRGNNFSVESGSFFVRVNVNQRQFTASKNRGADYDKYLYSIGISGYYNALNIRGCNPDNLLSWIRRFRNSLRIWLDKRLENLGISGVINTIFLGDKNAYSALERMRMLGISHILVISGLHFSIIHRYISWLAGLFKSHLIRMISTIAVMGFFLFFVDFGYSALRAFLIAIYYEVGRYMYKDTDPIIAQAFALGITLILFPYAILSASLYLSYYTYICVSFIYKRITKRLPPIYEILRFSIFVQVITIPIILKCFNRVNIFAFIANIAAVPIMGLIIPFSILSIIFGNFPIMGRVLLHITGNLTEILDIVAKLMPIKSILISDIRLEFFIALYALICLIFVFPWLYKYRSFYNTAISFGLCIIMIFFSSGAKTKVTFFDVGHGDCAFIEHGGVCGLIDTGDGRTKIGKLLLSRGVSRLDFVIISHMHKDHIGGLEEVFENLNVDKVFVNKSTRQFLAENQSEVLKSIAKSCIIISTDSVINFKKSRLSFKVYEFNDISNPNDDTIICVMDAGGVKGFFTGDASSSVMELVPLPNEMDFVKAGHHGSKTSISRGVYNGRSIDNIIISHGHRHYMPAKELIDLLNEHKYIYDSTYLSGEIQLIYKYGSKGEAMKSKIKKVWNLTFN